MQKNDHITKLNPKIKDMKRYYFELVNDSYNDLGALIPDGSHKCTAVNRAKRWMQSNGLRYAQLVVNSMRTSNIIEIIEIEL